MTRWNVELRNDIHDVGADRMTVESGGVLTFWQGQAIAVAYAPGHWIAVSEEEES